MLNRVMSAAAASKANLVRCDTDEMRDQIADTAKAWGHVDVWMDVFYNDPDMLQRLIKIFSDENAHASDIIVLKEVLIKRAFKLAEEAIINGQRIREGEGGTKYQPTLEKEALDVMHATLNLLEQHPTIP